MKAWIVKNKEDVEKHYYYKKSKAKHPVAPEFPCVMIEHDNDGGLAGQYYSYSFKVPPTEVEFEWDWMRGFIEGIKHA